MKESSKDKLRAAGIMSAGVGAKSLMSDFPKGTIDDLVEQAAKNKLFDKKTLGHGINKQRVLTAIKGRGAGRAAGGAAGLATFPLFLSGAKDLQKDTGQDKTKGMAKILASGLVYGGLKGGTEHLIEGASKGSRISRDVLLKNFTKGFKARGVPQLAAAAITGVGITKGIKDKRKAEAAGEKPSTWKVLPAATVAGLGAGVLKGTGEAILGARGPKGAKVPWSKIMKTPKIFVPKAISRGVTGALGAAVLGGITDKVLDALKKNNAPKVKKMEKVAGLRELPGKYCNLLTRKNVGKKKLSSLKKSEIVKDKIREPENLLEKGAARNLSALRRRLIKMRSDIHGPKSRKEIVSRFHRMGMEDSELLRSLLHRTTRSKAG